MNLLWKLVAKIISIPTIANWLINRAMKTPYYPIVKDGNTYMERFWLFNPYESVHGQQMGSRYRWFPWNIRVHHIKIPDQDRHLHDHPWNARTFILRGGYVEERRNGTYLRPTGATAKLNFGEFHRITNLQPGGAWTLFCSGPYHGTWGFLVEGVKVKWRIYLGLEDES